MFSNFKSILYNKNILYTILFTCYIISDLDIKFEYSVKNGILNTNLRLIKNYFV